MLLEDAGFRIENSEFLDIPTLGSHKGRLAIVAAASAFARKGRPPFALLQHHNSRAAYLGHLGQFLL